MHAVRRAALLEVSVSSALSRARLRVSSRVLWPAVSRGLGFGLARARLLGGISHRLLLGSSRDFSLGITRGRLMPMFLRLRAATMPGPGLALSPTSSAANFAGPHRLTPNRNFEGTGRKRRETPAPLAPGPSS